MTPIFLDVNPTLDGSTVTLGDGTVRTRHLNIPSGEYATPFWLRLDGNDDRLVHVTGLPWDGVIHAGQLEVLSSKPSSGGGSDIGTWRGNEPGYGTVVVDTDWSTLTEDGWSHEDAAGTGRIISDSGAPVSSPDVLEVEYPSGMSGGQDPVDKRISISGRDLYVAFVWKPSDPWDNHQSGVNKMLFWVDSDGSFPYFNWSNANSFEYVNRGNAAERNLPPNISDPSIDPGVWHQVEILFEHVSTTDWDFRVWVDGSKTHEYLSEPMQDADWSEFQITPTWGGVDDTKAQTDYFWFDHMYVSQP